MLQKCINNGAEIDVQNHYGKTALYIAVDEQMVDAVKVLLKNGASPDLQENELNWGALHKAVFHGNVEIVSSLIDSGADVNLLTSDGDTPLHMAAWKNHAKIARSALLSHDILAVPITECLLTPELKLMSRGKIDRARYSLPALITTPRLPRS